MRIRTNEKKTFEEMRKVIEGYLEPAEKAREARDQQFRDMLKEIEEEQRKREGRNGFMNKK